MLCELGEGKPSEMFATIYRNLPTDAVKARYFVAKHLFKSKLNADLARHMHGEEFSLGNGISGVQEFLDKADALYVKNPKQGRLTGAVTEVKTDSSASSVVHDDASASLGVLEEAFVNSLSFKEKKEFFKRRHQGGQQGQTGGVGGQLNRGGGRGRSTNNGGRPTSDVKL